jgi:hypothetical protein
LENKLKRNRSAYIVEDHTKAFGGAKYHSKLQMKKALLKLTKGKAYEVRLKHVKTEFCTYTDFWNMDMDYPIWTIGDVE